ncbi:MAG TPA: SRPBCC family protein [Polyangiaceae bacterium]|nr:SRPBCC family protein [Polyangiaceae bacterium]
MEGGTDRIQKKVILRAPLARVWQAVSDAREFGSWFGAEFDGPFAPGTHLTGRIVPTRADPEVAETQKPYEGAKFELSVESVVPERLISFRWHPFAVDPGVDYSAEPTTLIVFELREIPEGVLLTITESGFDRIPIARRAKAFTMNDQGWTAQMKLVEKHLANAA